MARCAFKRRDRGVGVVLFFTPERQTQRGRLVGKGNQPCWLLLHNFFLGGNWPGKALKTLWRKLASPTAIRRQCSATSPSTPFSYAAGSPAELNETPSMRPLLRGIRKEENQSLCKEGGKRRTPQMTDGPAQNPNQTLFSTDTTPDTLYLVARVTCSPPSGNLG